MNLFLETCDRVAAVHGTPLPKGLLTIGPGGDAHGDWLVKVNTTDAELDGIAPTNAMVFHGGLPCLYFSPFEGCSIGGDAAVEHYLAWLRTQPSAGIVDA